MKAGVRLCWCAEIVLTVSFLPGFSSAQSLTAQDVEIRAKANVLFARGENYFSAPGAPIRKETPRFRPAVDTLRDQKEIWTSPSRIRKADLTWLLPLGATMGLLIATDRHQMSLMHSNRSNRERSALISNTGLGALAGASVLTYGVGAFTRNDHARETGMLASEALVDSLVVSEALKWISRRQDPRTRAGHGMFGSSSVLDSFPSTHAALAWSAATIFAQEYPGPVTKWTAYGLASLVSVSRITAEQHFPSDVLAGAAAGYLIGKLVYKLHHDDRMNDRTGATAVSAAQPASVPPGTSRPRTRSAEKDGSPYVPLDSWIYPALKRLAALGYVRVQVSDMGPWTRAECLRQTKEAADAASSRSIAGGHAAQTEEALKLIDDLMQELKPARNPGAMPQLESVYTRFTGIGGTPLRDSYHFGQTIVNDYGRPYDKGINNVTGFSGYSVSGPFFAYLRGEYQHAPGRDPLPLNVRQFIANADANPLQGPVATAETNRFQPLEMYAGVKLGFENITFGKQSLWWGPGEASAFSFSNNAEPLYMLRLSQDRPVILPGILSKLGKIRTEIIFGKLSGHRWPARPYVNAQKISFDLTDNLELGFTRSAFFGGVGHPLTFGNLAASFVSTSSTGTGGYGDQADPGDRHSGFDFRYRIPGLRRYVTVYSDSFADDDPNPLDNPRRSAWAPGLYLSQIPGLTHLDFRFETYSTWLYSKDFGGNFLYWNNTYHDSYTNKGYLLGSWTGRDSRAYLASTTYWFSAKSKVQARYRQTKAGTAFLPGGGTQTDAGLAGQWAVTPEWMITAAAQYERYYVPVLGGPKQNFLTSIQVVFTPRR